MCSEEPIFVVKSSPQKPPDLHDSRRRRRCKNVQEKVLHINSKPKLTEYHKFYSFISRNEHERPVLLPRFDQPRSITYLSDAAEVRMRRSQVIAKQKRALNLPIFGMICVSLS